MKRSLIAGGLVAVLGFLPRVAIATGVSGFGAIGFVGLAAPLTARVVGGLSPNGRLVWSLMFGADLLCLADQAVQWLAGPRGERLPTGIATALLRGVLLLELARRRETLHIQKVVRLTWNARTRESGL